MSLPNWKKTIGGEIVGELVGSGKFVNQNTLAAGYYPRKARLTESPKVIANFFKQVVM